MTIRSGDIACRLRAVSSSDSPFSTELPFAAKESASAESHFSAVSKEKRVRVEASKKRFTTMRPRSAGTFLISRSPMGRMDSAVSNMSAISPADRSSVPRRSFERRLVVVMRDSKFQIPDSRSSFLGPDQTLRVAAPPGTWNVEYGICSGGFLQDPNLVGAVGLLEHDLDHLALGRRHALADVVRLDGNLAVPPVDQHGETHGTRTAEVDQTVQCRADRAPRVEDVVAQDNRAAVQVEIDLGLAQQRLGSDEREIVAVERDVQSADGKGLLHEIAQTRGQPCRQRDSPRANTDQSQVRQVLVPLGDLVRHAVDHPLDTIRIQDAGLLDQSFDQLAASLWAVFLPRQGKRTEVRGARARRMTRVKIVERRGFSPTRRRRNCPPGSATPGPGRGVETANFQLFMTAKTRTTPDPELWTLDLPGRRPGGRGISRRCASPRGP